MTRHWLLVIGAAIAVLAACTGVAPRPSDADLRQAIAGAYGLGEFDRIDAIRYTFNVQIGDKQISRSWLWEPETERVAYRDGGTRIEYNRFGPLDSDRLRTVDAKFINDNYWLLFPLHLAWDASARVVDKGMAERPIGPGQARRVVVSYPTDVGYTPGDVYELFVGADYRLQEWVYRKGGAAEPTRITTWDAHRQAGPLTFSLEHASSDGTFRLWFTDVAVRISGSSDWIEAE